MGTTIMTHDEIYETVCKDKFEDILKEIKTIQKGLFIDNGEESVQSKLNRHDRILVRTAKLYLWIAGALGGILGSVITALIIHRLVT